jgi:hypothetical protein
MKLVHPRADVFSFEAVVVFTGSVTLILLGVLAGAKLLGAACDA